MMTGTKSDKEEEEHLGGFLKRNSPFLFPKIH